MTPNLHRRGEQDQGQHRQQDGVRDDPEQPSTDEGAKYRACGRPQPRPEKAARQQVDDHRPLGCEGSKRDGRRPEGQRREAVQPQVAVIIRIMTRSLKYFLNISKYKSSVLELTLYFTWILEYSMVRFAL